MLAYRYGLPSIIIPSGRITRNLPPSSRPVEKLAPKCSAVSLVRFHTAGASQDRGDQVGSQEVDRTPKSLRSVQAVAGFDGRGSSSKRKANWLGKEES